MVKGQKRKVCRLKHLIFGLKQLSRQWYHWFHQVIILIGFMMTEEDHYMYVQKVKKKVIILSLNMNDILLNGNDLELIIATQKWLSFAFKMKDIGHAYYILGVKIQKDRSKRLLSLSQKTYIKRIL
jgi:hypothetical protein